MSLIALGVSQVYNHKKIHPYARNVHWIPLGMNYKFSPPSQTRVMKAAARNRLYLANFVGTSATSSERFAVIDDLHRHRNALPKGRLYIHVAKKWTKTYDRTSNYLSPNSFRQVCARASRSGGSWDEGLFGDHRGSHFLPRVKGSAGCIKGRGWDRLHGAYKGRTGRVQFALAVYMGHP